MKTQISIIVVIAFLALIGCGNTTEGMEKDSESNGQKAAEATQNLASGAKEAGKDIAAATMLTPKIKLAISADKRLNDSKNLIDVSATDETVTLEGHVASKELKNLATEIATKALKDNTAHQRLDNKLEIKP